jgi:23S rRNA (adenine2503-C2)-methyltransferase
MKIVAKAGNEDIAVVYIGEMGNGRPVEFAESVQPPIPRHKKWVLIVSTLFGCPVGCRFCDAGGYYQGKLSGDEMISQIAYLVEKRFPDRKVEVKKFKIQFARMGDPAFNRNVLDVLEELPQLYDAPGLMPTLSTVAPKGTEGFFERLLQIKQLTYGSRFQLQFSIHTTDTEKRDWLIPVEKWNLEKIAEYGGRFHRKGERKVTLNFALGDGMPIDPNVLLHHFAPDRFLIKITPVNPTFRASENEISSHILPNTEKYEMIDALREAGYEVILSIGELRENDIGSNCGQYITNYLREKKKVDGGYTYPLEKVREKGPVPGALQSLEPPAEIPTKEDFS